ncbi:hypothetical protein CHU98_g8433 [Xylaria longipes]|nr:hypothetical protein CHU98_g8433 [Xylaria longipes]
MPNKETPLVALGWAASQRRPACSPTIHNPVAISGTQQQQQRRRRRILRAIDYHSKRGQHIPVCSVCGNLGGLGSGRDLVKKVLYHLSIRPQRGSRDRVRNTLRAAREEEHESRKKEGREVPIRHPWGVLAKASERATTILGDLSDQGEGCLAWAA